MQYFSIVKIIDITQSITGILVLQIWLLCSVHCPLQKPFTQFAFTSNGSQFTFPRLPRGTSTALPLRTIFADKILITSTFRQLHRAPQTHIPDDTAQKLAAGDDITLDNITLAQDIAIRDASPGH